MVDFFAEASGNDAEFLSPGVTVAVNIPEIPAEIFLKYCNEDTKSL